MLPLLGSLLGIVGVFCILTGLIILLRSRIYKTAPPTKALAWLHADLDHPHFIERYIYRHHRKTGIALALAAGMWLWILAPLAAWRSFLALTKQYLDQLISSGYVPSLLITWLALSILFFGVLLALRPSFLKPLEAWANQWIILVPTLSMDPHKEKNKFHRFQSLKSTTIPFVLLSVGCICLLTALALGMRVSFLN